MIEVFEKMLKNHREHLDKLQRWKQAGGALQSYPEGETLDDFIKREETAISNIERAIEQLRR